MIVRHVSNPEMRGLSFGVDLTRVNSALVKWHSSDEKPSSVPVADLEVLISSRRDKWERLDSAIRRGAVTATFYVRVT